MVSWLINAIFGGKKNPQQTNPQGRWYEEQIAV